MTYISLSKKGYGTLEYLRSLDTNDIFDLIEFENISSDIEQILHDEVRNK